MEFSKKNLSGSKQEIKVTVSLEELEQNKEKALSFFQKEISLEGFRQGHVPKDIVKERVSLEQMFSKTIELSIQNAYTKLLKEENLKILGDPEIHVLEAKKEKPLVFSITVSLFPLVTLPDYKKIAALVKKKETEVKEEDIERTLQGIQGSKKKEDGTLPKLTDEFAKSLGNFSDLKELKEKIKEGLKPEKELQEKSRVRQEIMERVAKEANLEVPEVLIRQEQEALLKQTKQGVIKMLQIEFSEYLKNINKTEEELKESFLLQAENRIRQFLVLEAIAKKEEIAPLKEEVEQEMQKMLAQYSDQKTAKDRIDPKELKLYSEGVLRNEKTFQFLEGFTV